MDSGSVFGLMDLMVLACGGYILYAYYLLMTKNEIKKGVLLPQNQEAKKCKDMEAYKKFIGPKTLLCGLAAVASGGVGLYQDYVGPVSIILYQGLFILFIVIIIWFVVSIKQAEKRFW